MSKSETTVCLIGAGPAGLAVARALTLKGVEFDHFDAGSKVGGIWDIQRDDTPMYDSAHFISSKTMSGFEGYPMPESYPDYPRHDKIEAYIMDFANAHGLTDNIRFNTKITDLEKLEDGAWRVAFSDGTSKAYLGVICATGTQWTPRMPELKGQFDGALLHSSVYKSPEMFTGKRVLIVGAGNSGCDIACDAAANAREAYISMRRGYYFIPKHIFGKPADVFDKESPNLPLWISRPIMTFLLNKLVGDTTKLGLQKPDHKLFESHPLMNAQLLHYLQHGDIAPKVDIDRLDGKEVLFKDGSRIEVDLILCATGYSQKQGFARDYFDYRGGRPQMFLQIFNRRHKNLFGISHIETNSGAFKMFDQMALMLANYLRDQIDGKPSVAKMDRHIASSEPDLSNGIRFVKSDRHTGYVNSDTYKKYLDKLSRKLGWKTLKDEDLKGFTEARRRVKPMGKAA
ncbi:flavin-containing monooxygenase [Pseudophaeobacter arcticus]|jgi:hypothetical protein|uniref:flavin-containing monooxygenase n=1 Tax=Pseudophaeobacter arcticus TaxID=385492 RepID=UPI0039E3B167